MPCGRSVGSKEPERCCRPESASRVSLRSKTGFAVKLSLRCLVHVLHFAIASAAGLGYAGEASPISKGGASGDAHQTPNVDYSAWAVDPTAPGADLPPAGRSLFDHLVSEPASKRYQVPFPFSALSERIRARLAQGEYNGGTRVVLIPMGRSLQRTAAAPDFFKYPRIVFAVTGEPATDERDAGMLLKDRLYIAYLEKTGLLEVISYNEAAGRFEFQLVKDYRRGGQPRVVYANRAICISCHQNHAPIFSKAVWSETNANGHVAQLLRSQGGDFDLSAQANIDYPDDVDKATVRANTLVTLQSLWQKGCEDAQNRWRSERCRAAAFEAILQYGLSGSQDFASDAPGYQSDFVSTFSKTWLRTWPQGLSVAQSALPDRNPFGGAVSPYGGGALEEAAWSWIAAAHVPAALDPLNPRPAREIWRFAGAADSRRLIAGWAKFFAIDDFRALDAYLVRKARGGNVGRSVYRAPCNIAQDPLRAKELRLECASGASVANYVALAARFGEAGDGKIEWVNFGAAGQARDVVFSSGAAQRVGAERVLRAIPNKKGAGVRLSDGRAVESVEMRWREGRINEKNVPSMEARVTVVVVDDFAPVRQAIERLLATQSWLFDNAPLARASLMHALFQELGSNERSWCCADSSGMPPAELDAAEASASAIAISGLQPFFRNCATCHLTHEQFPPNFLSGDDTRVVENLRQCAPRMLVRLMAWRKPAEQRVKSPMPPAMFLRRVGLAAEPHMQSEELELMRQHLEGLLVRDGGSSDVDELLKNGYEALPQCLAPR